MKTVDVNSNTFIEFNKKNNKEDPKFEFGDYVRMFCKNIIQKYFYKRLCSKLV